MMSMLLVAGGAGGTSVSAAKSRRRGSVDPPSAQETAVGMMPLKVDGALSDAALSRMDSDFRRGLARGAISIRDVPVRSACEDAPCFSALAEASGLVYVVELRITVRSRDYEVEGRLHARSGEIVAEVVDDCEICGLDEAAGVVEGVAARLASEISGLLGEDAPFIRIESEPEGAEISIDGLSVGMTPFEGELLPGAHVIRVRAPGHVAVEREVTMVEGVRTTAEFNLDLLSDDARDPKVRAWGAAGVGVGLGLFGIGVGILAVQPGQYRRRCSGPNVDADGDCRYVMDPRWPGATFIAVGSALTTVGVMMLIREMMRGPRPHAAKTERATASLRATVGLRSVGVSGRF